MSFPQHPSRHLHQSHLQIPSKFLLRLPHSIQILILPQRPLKRLQLTLNPLNKLLPLWILLCRNRFPRKSALFALASSKCSIMHIPRTFSYMRNTHQTIPSTSHVANTSAIAFRIPSTRSRKVRRTVIPLRICCSGEGPVMMRKERRLWGLYRVQGGDSLGGLRRGVPELDDIRDQTAHRSQICESINASLTHKPHIPKQPLGLLPAPAFL
jgi:hypothetical protein